MEATTFTKREFVVRLDQGGGDRLYDRLREESYKRSLSEQRQVPMTELARKALEEFLAPDGRPVPPQPAADYET